ncbi:uncharacterized protein KY384_002750 [Bacidia gigantensis]|uniref:uncharacterized protein n=1 Tax=Bacidia gigantensis TaxID=2732470 RepID=UPI001D0372EA|nr:uncharacterized protein KY384_002750 [Bacidia gigantensis]KAG8532872.1 hypothetical protein KY384_002750 [Bacidia gigantensis]
MIDSQADDEPVIQEFLENFKNRSSPLWRQGCVGSDNDVEKDSDDSKYVTRKTLEDWLTAQKVESLLKAVIKESNGPRPSAENIWRLYLRPFAILLCLFSRAQWGFCPVAFYFDMDERLPTSLILPISSKQQLEESGSSITYKISVDKELDTLVTGAGQDIVSENGPYNTYVLKTYRTRDASKYYDNECNAFRRLRHGNKPYVNIIAFYGGFAREGVFNIFLEYADRGNLDEYMQKTRRPSRMKDRIMFWHNFLDVGHGISVVHGYREEIDKETGVRIPLGWHQDVNPSNILVKSRKGGSDYDCDFKLADLGLAHFTDDASSPWNATDKDTYGTTAYGAPETHRENDKLRMCRLTVRQSVDIWSWGCVLSETATWVCHGWHALLDYRRKRSEEVLLKTGVKEDIFHSHDEVLYAVRQMHDDIIENRMVNDNTIEEIVKLVEEMLFISDLDRPASMLLYRKSRRIVDESKRQIEASRTQSNQFHGRPETPSTSHRSHQLSESGASSRSKSNPTGSRPSGINQSPMKLHSNEVQHPYKSSYSSPSDVSSGFSSTHSFHTPPNFGSPDQPLPFRQQRRADSHPQATNQAASLIHFSSLNDHNNKHRMNPHATVFGNQESSNPTISSGESPGTEHDDVFSTGESIHQYVQDDPSDYAPQIGIHNQSHIHTQPHEKSMQTHTSDTMALQNGQPSERKPYPEMLVKDGLHIKRSRERGQNVKFPNEKLLESLKVLDNRDHAFFIDIGKSMAEHSAQVREVVELLFYMVEHKDPDGVDLYFSAITPKRFKVKNKKQILDALDDHPSVRENPEIRHRLASILGHYKTKFGQRQLLDKVTHWNATPSRGPRKLSLYVLTDGVWQPDTDLVLEIQDMVDHLEQHKLRDKQIGIQFIQFGNDPIGTARLRHLDQGLNLKLDIIDTTPATGNVWKMLLGAINDWFDNDKVGVEENAVVAHINNSPPPPSAFTHHPPPPW